MRPVIAGAGGHARSVIEALRSQGIEPAACTDPDPARRGQHLDGVLIAGDDSELERLFAHGVQTACLGIGGVRDNGQRARLFARLRDLGFELPPVIHISATVAGSAGVGTGSQVLAGAVIGAGAELGADVIVNTGAVVEHDCWVGDHAHLATRCALGGSVEVGAGAHVGLGACVLQGVRIGEGAVVGAGAVVIRNVPDGALAVGVPASTRAQGG